MKTWFAAALISLAVVNAPCQAQQSIPPSTKDIRPLLLGEQAPAITLLTSAGESRTLAQLANDQPLAIIFYRGG
jgi:uncharacterized protein YcfL